MGLWALTLAGVQRLKRQNFGTKITDNEGNPSDTAVQPFANELIAALSDQNPVDMPAPLVLNAPGGNGPSIIVNRFSVDNLNNDNSGNKIQSVNGGTIRFINQNGQIIDIPGPNGSPISITNADGSGGGTSGYTGTVTVITNVTVSMNSSGSVVVSGCTGNITITNTGNVTLTTENLNFQNGLLISVG